MSLLRRLSGSVTGTAALNLLFFLLYYLYLWLVVDLHLIYHGGGIVVSFPVFYRGWEFFRGTVPLPGGLVEYVSAFLGQFFYIGWAGALVATVQAWLLWLCTASIVRNASGRQVRWVCFVAPILLLIPYARYIYPFGIAMGLLAAFGFVCLYMGATLKRRPTDMLVFLALSIILYVVAGGAYLLFMVVCGIYELFLRRRTTLGITFLLSVPIVGYIVSVAVFKVSIIYVFSDFMPRSYEIDTTKLTVTYVLYLLLPITLVGLWPAELLRRSKVMLPGQTSAVTVRPKTSKKNRQSSLGQFITLSVKKVAGMFAPLLAIVTGVLVAYFCHSSSLKTQIAVNYYSCNRMWREVLEVAARYPQNKFINHAADRALYHTGRMTQEMFAYGQQPGALMLSAESAQPLGYWRLFDTYIDLGQMNLAESALVLLTDAYGERPIFLKRLALINLIKGDTGTACVYLGALSRTLFDAGWAKGYLERIERDPNLSTDKEVQQLRSMMPVIDRDFESLKENIFLDLLARNKHNRMAFEYLAAFYLLTNQLDKFVGNLEHLNDFDYAGIPRVYEEGILLYAYTTKKKFEVPGREISVESRARFERFIGAYIGRYGANKMMALNEMSRDYGDSYFFYYVYGPSGVKK